MVIPVGCCCAIAVRFCFNTNVKANMLVSIIPMMSNVIAITWCEAGMWIYLLHVLDSLVVGL